MFAIPSAADTRAVFEHYIHIYDIQRGRGQANGVPNSLPFEDRRQALSYPDAERRDAARGAGASHLVDQRRGQALQPSG